MNMNNLPIRDIAALNEAVRNLMMTTTVLEPLAVADVFDKLKPAHPHLSHQMVYLRMVDLHKAKELCRVPTPGKNKHIYYWAAKGAVAAEPLAHEPDKANVINGWVDKKPVETPKTITTSQIEVAIRRLFVDRLTDRKMAGLTLTGVVAQLDGQYKLQFDKPVVEQALGNMVKQNELLFTSDSLYRATDDVTHSLWEKDAVQTVRLAGHNGMDVNTLYSDLFLIYGASNPPREKAGDILAKLVLQDKLLEWKDCNQNKGVLVAVGLKPVQEDRNPDPAPAAEVQKEEPKPELDDKGKPVLKAEEIQKKFKELVNRPKPQTKPNSGATSSGFNTAVSKEEKIAEEFGEDFFSILVQMIELGQIMPDFTCADLVSAVEDFNEEPNFYEPVFAEVYEQMSDFFDTHFLRGKGGKGSSYDYVVLKRVLEEMTLYDFGIGTLEYAESNKAVPSKFKALVRSKDRDNKETLTQAMPSMLRLAEVYEDSGEEDYVETRFIKADLNVPSLMRVIGYMQHHLDLLGVQLYSHDDGSVSKPKESSDCLAIEKALNDEIALLKAELAAARASNAAETVVAAPPPTPPVSLTNKKLTISKGDFHLELDI